MSLLRFRLGVMRLNAYSRGCRHFSTCCLCSFSPWVVYSRWSYLLHTIPDNTDLLQPLEDVIHQLFIPALFGRPPCSSTERDLYALPVRLGGLGLVNPCSAASSSFHDSEKLTAPLVALIAAQCMIQTVDRYQVCHLKQSIRKTNQPLYSHADTLHNQLSPSLIL